MRALVDELQALDESVYGTIWKQIPITTKMAIGARQPHGKGKTLTFKVLRASRYVQITLLPGDTYEVEFFRTKRGSGDRVSLAKSTHVYADQLGEILYGITHGKIE